MTPGNAATSPSAHSPNAGILSRSQFVALWAGILTFSLVGLFPPWQQRTELFLQRGFIERPLGRHAWWSPPKEWKVRSWAEEQRSWEEESDRIRREGGSAFLLGPPPPRHYVGLDSTRVFVESARIRYAQLGIELTVITLLTGGLVVTLHRRRGAERTAPPALDP